MGTRCDFYVGRGLQAEWLGSVAYDGYPDSFPKILKAKTEKVFRAAVTKELAGRDDSTKPEEGWPWPWEDSGTTDFAYAFDGGTVFRTGHNKDHVDVWVGKKTKFDEDGYALDGEPAVHPNMKNRMKVKMPGTPGSGMLLIGRPRG